MACKHCGCSWTKTVRQIAGVATFHADVCGMCGRVQKYVEELMVIPSVTPWRRWDLGDTKREPREWVVRRRVAIQPPRQDDTRQYVVDGLKAGISVAEIAETLDLKPSYVHAIGVNEHLVQPTMKETILEEIKARTHLDVIANAVGTSIGYVRKVAKEAGLTPTQTRLSAARAARRAEIAARYASGVSQYRIAKELGVHPATICQLLKRERGYQESSRA